jgi:hypothetical protein
MREGETMMTSVLRHNIDLAKEVYELKKQNAKLREALDLAETALISAISVRKNEITWNRERIGKEYLAKDAIEKDEFLKELETTVAAIREIKERG